MDTKTVLITGASSGIGLETSRFFAKHGYNLIITARREEKLNQLKNKLESAYNNKVHVIAFDIRELEACQRAYNEIKANNLSVDILVNNAGLAKGKDSFENARISDWDQMIDTNLKGLLYISRLIVPDMIQQQSGHIINVASLAGKEAYPMGNVYCATKHAVDGLTRAMRLDLYKHNIRVSQVAPGMVEETEFSEVRFDGDKNKAEMAYNDFNPLRAYDVAETIYFIASRPAYVNIQDVLLMGTQQANSTMFNKSGKK